MAVIAMHKARTYNNIIILQVASKLLLIHMTVHTLHQIIKTSVVVAYTIMTMFV